MTSCNAAELLYRLVPVRPWRALLIRVHFERCPRCQKELAGAAEVRSLLAQEADCQLTQPLWEDISRSLAAGDQVTAEKPRPLPASRPWAWAAAGIVLAVLAGYWALRDFRPMKVAPGAGTPARFELEYVRVGGRPAEAYVYQPQGSDMIIVWAGKAN